MDEVSPFFDYEKVYRAEFNTPNYSIHPLDDIRYVWPIERLDVSTTNIADIGSGRGWFIKALKSRRPEIKVTSVDLDKFHDVEDVEFIRQDITRPQGPLWSRRFDEIICLDVLEHISYQEIDGVLVRLSSLSTKAIFNIANHSHVGKSGELHLIQEDKNWWEQKLLHHWNVEISETICDGLAYVFKLKNKET